jgi:2-C-methyl-D-erythritol 4-phosphate cytidylyltransferase
VPVSAVAILVAAGPGTRLGAGVPKGFVDLAGEPLVIHSLRAMLAAPSIASAVVVVPVAEQRRMQTLIDAGRWGRPVRVVAGGPERQDSVRCGLDAAPPTELVAIHDAARPFVTAEVIEAAIDAAARCGAAIAAVAAIDTVKQAGDDGIIAATLARDRIWLAQTPQVFRAELIHSAHAAAMGGSGATDDALLVEQLGHPVRIVRGNPENRKITTPADLRWAAWLLAERAAPR